MNALISQLPWSWMGEMARIALWMTPLIAVLLLARPWLRKWIGGRGMALVWAVVTVRLLVPMAWEVSQEWNAEVREMVGRKEVVLGENVGVSEGKAPEMGESGVKPDWGQRIAVLWLMGTAAFAGWLLLGMVRLWRLPTGEVKDGALLNAWVGVDERLKGKVALKWSAVVSAPALVALGGGKVGFAIWVPEDWRLSEEQWRHVLLHELGHYRRGDLWMQWLGALAQALYWWNPLIWLAVRAGAEDREIACDEWVRQNWVDVEEYGATLIAISRRVQNGGMMPGAVLMATGRQQLKKRVEAMVASGVKSLWRGLTLGSVVLFGAVILSARAEIKPKIWPWQEGWDSLKFREEYRKSSPSSEVDFYKIQSWGGLELQVRGAEVKKTETRRLLTEILGREGSSVERASSMLFLTAEEAQRALDCLGNAQLIPTILLPPHSQGKQKTTERLSARMRVEIAQPLSYAVGFSSSREPISVASETLGLGIEVEWKKGRDVYELAVEGYASEVMGFYHFREANSPYRPVPWKEDILERNKVTPPALTEALPVMRFSKAPGTIFLSESEEGYFLLRSLKETVKVGHVGPPPAEGAALFHDHPARKREYWFLIRLRYLPPEKPPAP